MKTKDIIIGMAIAVFLALVVSPFASSFPDGLEKVAEHLGFIEKGEGVSAVKAPIPDYQFPGVKNEAAATSVAGVLGTILVFGATWGIGKAIGRKRV